MSRATSRFSAVSPYTTSRASATGQYSKSTHRKIADFDAETKNLLVELETRQKREKQDLHNEWLFSHGSETSRENKVMRIRATDARKQALYDHQILELHRKRRFSSLSKRHEQEMQEFVKNRNHERNLIISDLTRPTSVITERCISSLESSVTRESTKKAPASFKISKHRLITNESVRIGRFQGKREVPFLDASDDGDLLDLDNLDRVLAKKDGRYDRYEREAEFIRTLV